MKILATVQTLCILSCLLQCVVTEHRENILKIGSDAWLYCHGMPQHIFIEVCQCMVEYKKKLAEKWGLDVDDKKWEVNSTIIGDIMFSQTDCYWSLYKLDNIKRKKRKFYEQDSNHTWSFPILYQFHEDTTLEDHKMIEAAMAHWTDKTCVRFEEYEPSKHGSEYDIDLLEFTNMPNGCYSYIGKQTQQPQQINLQTNGCTGWIGVVVHEIGHALGLFHEQNRLDREFWVRFYPNNVNPEVISNFDLEPDSKSFDVPYDYGSVMQYDNRAFSALGGIVLEAILPYSEYTMGQRGHLSYLDAKIMNKGYCSKECIDYPMLPCGNGGYPDPNDCTRCRCPEGFGGQLCETAAPSDPECYPDQPVLEAMLDVQCLQSPGYDQGYYPSGVKCNWIIQAPPGEQIRAQFDGDFGVYCSGSARRGPMCFHWVEIKHKVDKETRGGRFCCYDNTQFIWNNPGTIVSENNIMVVHFDATWPQFINDYTIIPSPEARRGFTLCFALNSGILPLETNKTDYDYENPDNPDGNWWFPDSTVPSINDPSVGTTNTPTDNPPASGSKMRLNYTLTIFVPMWAFCILYLKFLNKICWT